MQVLDALEQLDKAVACISLGVGAPLQHGVQELATRQQLCDEINLDGSVGEGLRKYSRGSGDKYPVCTLNRAC